MMRKIISIFFFFIGGFFVYMVSLLAFTNIPEVGVFKFAIICGFCIPALIFLVIGSGIRSFQNWKYHIGIVLLSVSGVNLLIVINFICIFLTPELLEYFPSNPLAYFNDYFSGSVVMIFLAALGGFLIRVKKISEP